MNILLITQFPPPNGGIASWSQAFLSEFERKGDDLFSRNNERILVVNNSIVGRRLSFINGKKYPYDEIKRVLNVIISIRKWIKRMPIDCVHYNVTCAKMGLLRDNIVLMFIPKGTPMLLHCHCSVVDQVKESRVSRVLLKRLLGRCSMVLVLNESSRQYISALSIIGKKIKCEIVSNFIEEKYINFNHRYASGSLKSLIYTGRFEEAKGSKEIIQVAKAFPDIEIRIIGAIDDSVLSESLPKNIILMGNKRREEVLEELDNADAFIFPSHAEGFSMALLEAMARGLPVIASDVGANKEMIGVSGGYIFQKGNVSEIKKYIKNLNDPKVRETCGRANLLKVGTEYTATVVVNRISYFYRSIIN